ncbi:MAG TPA: STAS domain-containing protein [Polyangiales bacterium]|nr:STAS domain-containing protein [Polyangiales bacterium]
MGRNGNVFSEVLDRNQGEVLEDWLREQQAGLTRRRDLMSDAELREQSAGLLGALRNALPTGVDVESVTWQPVRTRLEEISRSRARLGFSPSETALFVFSLKQPVFARMKQANASLDDVWVVSQVLDKLGLYTTEVFQRAREEVISRQQAEMLELSTPVVQLWDGVLALPLIGTLDSRRTQLVMEALLQRIVETGSEFAIIDITGVPTVDTLTAQHLIKTITATRLMGAECIISGIRPQIAQTIVHLGVDLGDVTTKSSLAGALELALRRSELMVIKKPSARAAEKA